MAINSGILKASNITAAASDAGYGQAPDQRKLYDFSDRVAELTPEESPFFTYLANVSKVATDDNVFRFLENRTQINHTDRSFLLAAHVNGEAAVAVNEVHAFTVDTAAGAAVEYLTKGMVFAVSSLDTAAGYTQVLVRVESGPATVGSTSTFQGRVIGLSDANTATGYNVLSDDDVCQIIGTSFEEGTASPDTFSDTLDDGFGYTQIFKTACELTNTAIATRHRGYANEFDRIWAQKLREHKIDIERAMLFGQKARYQGVQYTEGLVGNILKNVAPNVNNTALSYSSGKGYYRSTTTADLTYDRLLSDMEVIFDPARGGASEKLVMASLPVISFFNKMGDGAFIDASVGHANGPYRVNMDNVEGSFGHKLMEINTVHGSMFLVKQPLFRGMASGMMLMADMSQLAYRPLVGNGLNRDTQIMTNVQSADEDLRKDMILTEAGLEITLPESHALYNVEGL
mgnify:FL=1|tara:strand:- start:559 stop:1932 length:1374 start_codon:yes stop_codon:yes gene_type:complete